MHETFVNIKIENACSPFFFNFFFKKNKAKKTKTKTKKNMAGEESAPPGIPLFTAVTLLRAGPAQIGAHGGPLSALWLRTGHLVLRLSEAGNAPLVRAVPWSNKAQSDPAASGGRLALQREDSDDLRTADNATLTHDNVA
jgi:hypothetical protein